MVMISWYLAEPSGE